MISPALIAQMPKIELHCHLDGSLSLGTIKQLAENAGITLPATDAEILERAQAPEHTQSLLEYLERFDFVLPLLQTAENLELAAYDVVAQASADNVKYIEIRFAPSQHLKQGLTLATAVEAVIAGLKKAEADFPVIANALVCGLRQESLASLSELTTIFDELSSKETKLAGFDLAGDELNFPQIGFDPLLGEMTSRGIHITLHAGECPGCSQNVLDSVKMGASRIGHGIMTKDLSEAEQASLKEKAIVLEMAPSSNFQTKAIKTVADYPFKTLYDKGLHVTLNTDNRTVSNTNLQQEYEKIAGWYPDFKLSDFEQINHYAIDGAFVAEAVKQELHQSFEKSYQALA
ncbi:adenosine deaminase [Lactococcus termiticola]|uniref:Adenosine deaminase n=1 Tax=Lactococcus termiticola TaxID=2169526 RepID=A0A2R5HEH7_9LACT|nr:adenosine deaminase [Lactococcus termiticola]GBG96484.1 adenosine deaminase [Lactococcus termiticola]